MISKYSQKPLTPKADQRNSSKICNDAGEAVSEGDAEHRSTLRETAGAPTEIRTEHLQNRQRLANDVTLITGQSTQLQRKF
jgi:hypothetical protein